MNLVKKIKKTFLEAITQMFSVDPVTLGNIQLVLNVDKNKQDFGDLSCNVAMVLAKELGRSPRAIADKVIEEFNSGKILSTISSFITKIELAGPGFLNIFLSDLALQKIAKELFLQKEDFFKLNDDNEKLKYLIEFVSANPTGPLHLGHGRGGIIGDTIARVLNFLGHDAKKEFYINDAGNQIEKLGLSFKVRCLQELGQNIELPEDGYKGKYLIELAKICVKEFGQDLLSKDELFFGKYAKKVMLGIQQEDLKKYGIDFDNWFSEKTLHDSGAVEAVIQILIDKDLAYEDDGALWFRATKFGDDKDRVICKKTGELTYIAADIAYHKNKFDRGYNKLIDILGQDHHGYVKRLKSTIDAIGLDSKQLDVILYQLVSIKNAGQIERMSKRAGRFTTLIDVIDAVGVDVARFFYLNRKAEAHLDFDLSVALKKTDENPVFYIQYAYVRTGSVLEKALDEPLLKDFAVLLIEKTLSIAELENILKYLGPEEFKVIKKLISLSDVLATIEGSYQTHLLSYYLFELANSFHSYYANNKIIDKNNIEQSKGRMFTLNLVRNQLYLGLDLLGLSKPERM